MLDASHDFETAATVELRTAGAHRYAMHPSTIIWCMAWRLGDQRGIWRTGERFPQDFLDHVRAGGMVKAHNAAFERSIWNHVLPRYVPGLPPLRIEQQDCTMARCATLGIPSSLEDAGHVLGLDTKKDKQGHANMLVLAKPKGWAPDSSPVWADTPERLALQYRYCAQDVAVEEAIDERVPPLSAMERRVWALDQTINDRGVMLDLPTIRAALLVVQAEKQRLDDRMTEVTGGAVTAVTQVAKLVAWINSRGIPCAGMAKALLPGILRTAEMLDDNVAEAIRLRREGAKTSTAKLNAMLNCVCDDGRARGLLQYHGAAPGRWAGRLIQPQNLYRTDPEEDGDDIHQAITLLASAKLAPEQKAPAISVLCGSETMTMLAKCLRSMFIAKPGHRFVGGDLANIEGRVAAWIADEHWKIKAFQDYDAGTGPDLYRVAYARAFGVVDPATVTGRRRQVGKVTELSLQYQGSVGAWIKMAANYGVHPADVVPVVREAVGDVLWLNIAAGYRSATDKYGLPEDQWTAIKIIVKGWREAHPDLVQGWWDLQDAAIEAVAAPGSVVPVFGGRVRYMASRGFLWCSLPSGRVNAYFNPRVVSHDESYFEKLDGQRVKVASLREGEREELLAEGAELVKLTRRRVDYDGFDGEHKKWATMNLYGGMQFNHIVQGTARDILAEGMLDAEASGYPVVLTVHDELLTEVPHGTGSADELAAIMSRVPSWVDGVLPLAAKAWEDTRYAK